MSTEHPSQEAETPAGHLPKVLPSRAVGRAFPLSLALLLCPRALTAFGPALICKMSYCGLEVTCRQEMCFNKR